MRSFSGVTFWTINKTNPCWDLTGVRGALRKIFLAICIGVLMYVFIETYVAFYGEYRGEGGVRIGPLFVSKNAKRCEKSANYIKEHLQLEHLELPDCKRKMGCFYGGY